jgi:hypothetical protein
MGRLYVSADNAGVDARMKTFEAEARNRLDLLCADSGFLGPQFDDHGGGYPVVLSLRYHRPSGMVEVCLVLAYGGEEYVATSLTTGEGDQRQASEIGCDTARSGFQMRRALDRQAAALAQALAARR